MDLWKVMNAGIWGSTTTSYRSSVHYYSGIERIAEDYVGNGTVNGTWVVELDFGVHFLRL